MTFKTLSLPVDGLSFHATSAAPPPPHTHTLAEAEEEHHRDSLIAVTFGVSSAATVPFSLTIREPCLLASVVACSFSCFSPHLFLLFPPFKRLYFSSLSHPSCVAVMFGFYLFTVAQPSTGRSHAVPVSPSLYSGKREGRRDVFSYTLHRCRRHLTCFVYSTLDGLPFFFSVSAAEKKRQSRKAEKGCPLCTNEDPFISRYY